MTRQPAPGFDVMAIGETMAMVAPLNGDRLDAEANLVLRAGGAESNVAAMMAMLGLRTAWVSALGADPLGDLVLAEVAARGVDVDHVRRDPTRPTAAYFKSPSASGTTVYYYRSGSAASAMGPELITESAVEARLIHLSGITAALSPTCADLVDHVVRHRPPGNTPVSFDVNYRPTLWPEPPGRRLLGIAQQCDIVFVGRDEAEALWGTAEAEAVRRLVDRPRHLIIKDGAVEAVAYDGDTVTRQPSLPVEVVEAVGAGDAFAAGWLAGHLRGASAQLKLKIGHWVAGQVLQSPSDLAEIPDLARVSRLVGGQDGHLVTANDDHHERGPHHVPDSRPSH